MNLKNLSILGLLTFPSLAFACACGDLPRDRIIIALALFILVPFLLFFLIGHFRDRQHRFRYSSLCVFPAEIITLSFLFFGIPFLEDMGIFISYEFLVGGFIILSFCGGVFLAEYKAKKSKKQNVEKT